MKSSRLKAVLPVRKFIGAVCDQNFKKVEKLLQEGMDVNSYENDACATALHFAVQANNVKKAKLLLHHGADPLVLEQLSYQSPLELAVEFGLVEMQRILLHFVNRQEVGPIEINDDISLETEGEEDDVVDVKKYWLN